MIRENGGIFAGQKVTGSLEFVTIYSLVELAEGNVNAGDDHATTAADNLNELALVLTSVAQPVIMNLQKIEGADAGDYEFGTGATVNDVYAYRFSIEHAFAFAGNEKAVGEIEVADEEAAINALIDGLKAKFGDVDFNTSDAANKNTYAKVTMDLV